MVKLRICNRTCHIIEKNIFSRPIKVLGHSHNLATLVKFSHFYEYISYIKNIYTYKLACKNLKNVMFYRVKALVPKILCSIGLKILAY